MGFIDDENAFSGIEGNANLFWNLFATTGQIGFYELYKNINDEDRLDE